MSRIWKATSLVMAVVMAVLIAPQPARASTFPTVPNCFGLNPNSESTFYLGWGMPNTWGAPDTIWNGDIIQLVAVGTVKIGAWPWDPQYGPEGSGQEAPAGFPYSQPGNTAKYQMIWAFKSGQPFKPYEQGRCYSYFGSRTNLLAQMNDNNLGDNGGGWEVKVRHYWTGS